MSIDTPSTDAEIESSSDTPRTGSTTFINTSGGLLTEELVGKVRQRQCGESAVRPETFALPNTEPPEEADIEAEIGNTWNTLRERWDELTMDETLFHMDVSDARNKWILKLFRNLGFEPVFQRENLEAGGIEANLSHKGWPDGEIENYGELEGRTAPIIHTVKPEQKLDQKPENAPRGRKSPHDTLQEFLNASDEHDWAVVTNGLTLRVLRDFYHTYTRGYVEFDLENIFTTRNYGDFRGLYRLCHATRFIDPIVADEEEDDIETPLEQLYQVALSTGVKVGQDLQSNVVSAIETLGTGLLNQEIREFLKEGGEEEAKEYYQEVLLLVYRLLFLMYAEQRGMMASRDSLYTNEYSITNLRRKAENRRSGSDRNTDLWHGLQSTFRLVEKGDDELGVPCYNGMLFDSNRFEWVSEAECFNDDLLDAIEDLTLIEHEGTRQRISYADLGVEEIGSVYESLLEFTPRLASEVIELEDRTITRGKFYLDDRGTERKETGSYYTDPGLVQELIQSSLEPVVEDRMENAVTTPEQEEALLDISVCDPASGSGAFLIAANNFLAQRLARIRSDSDYPPGDKIREARRDVLQHCIYAVDLNPMAVELAKVSLWINSAVEDKPLNFLDHRIKQGNSLVGTNRDLINRGVPADAYETSKGRDWHIGNEIRKRVRQENSELNDNNQQIRLDTQWDDRQEDYVSLAEQLDQLEESEVKNINKKQKIYNDLRESENFQREKLAHDVWTAAFYWPLDGSAEEYPTPNIIEQIRRNPPTPSNSSLSELTGLQAVRERATQLAEKESFFHWKLEFPEVYAAGGFDCIIGNPPWEIVEFEEREFFAVQAPHIADASTQSERRELISELEKTDPELYSEYQSAVNRMESRVRFLKESGRYELTGTGHVNTYSTFTEHALSNINNYGRCGIIVPQGIATDSNTQEFFQHIVEKRRLISLLGFENRSQLFPDVDGRFNFCLLTLSGRKETQEKFELAFYLTEIDQLQDEQRRFNLSKRDIKTINPNTKTCPTFQNREDANLTLNIHRRTDILKKEADGSGNQWDISLERMFHMSNDSGLFETSSTLQQDGFELSGNIFVKDDLKYLPVYEAKYIHQHDHRFATYEGIENAPDEKPRKLSPEKKDVENKRVIPRYWIKEDEYKSQEYEDWHLLLRAITNATNERTVIASLAPSTPTVNSVNHVLGVSAPDGLILSSCLNSYVLDFVARQKVGGTNLSQFIIKQLPVPTPEKANQIQLDNNPIRKAILERAEKLIYTGSDLSSIGSELNNDSDPYQFTEPDGKKREEVRYELEALICHLYGIHSEEFKPLFDSFKQIKQRDQQKYGYYRTRDEIKRRFDDLAPRITYESKSEQ
ncbi:Eco57I restriction-modification methylase domain-containing protein [Haloquadratum walsbyi]|uniref:site-specific DNA-methyltransferase (adenine-specific) n=1 Tax=Haloquadratum walsbyi (strain DSM 16854 / JCM 12705 / C23) TaxID=768065 RepID=G0LNF1_HALWC|nr:N-6 DNA methylase [Haloquadratum walsbyi]CCC41957.1 probable restriction/modification enzyme [Haloquadratum walsbyi C23]